VGGGGRVTGLRRVRLWVGPFGARLGRDVFRDVQPLDGGEAQQAGPVAEQSCAAAGVEHGTGAAWGVPGEKREAQRMAVRDRWHYLNGLYAGRRCA